MDYGDVQIYDKPKTSFWKNPWLWFVTILSLLVGVGMAVYL